MITTFFIKSSLYSFGGTIAMFISAVSVFTAGAIGAFIAIKIYQTRTSKIIAS